MSPGTGFNRQSHLPSLVMTDYFFLAGAAIAWLLAILIDPLDPNPREIPGVRHLSGALLIAAWLLTAAGRPPGAAQDGQRGVTDIFLPLIVLGVFLLAGSSYARFGKGIEATFLGAGLYMMLAPVSAYLLIHSRDPRRLLAAYMGILMLGSVWVILELAMNYGIRQVHHELEYIVPPLALLFLFGPVDKQRYAVGAFFLCSALLFKKNTGYLTFLLLLGYLAYFRALPSWRGVSSIRRAWLIWCAALFVMLVGVLVLYLLAERETYLPTGNTDFRFFTYERAWSRFLDSPVFGTGFATAAAEAFTLFDTGLARNILPTHSDVLDVAAHGGLIGLGLLVWALARIGRLSWTYVLHPGLGETRLAPYAHACAGMSLAAVLTYAFNPIWLQPAKALILWSSLGLLGGIALLACQQPSSRTT